MAQDCRPLGGAPCTTPFPGAGGTWDYVWMSLTRLKHRAKVKGLCRCNYGPELVNFRLIQRETVLSGPDVITQTLGLWV